MLESSRPFGFFQELVLFVLRGSGCVVTDLWGNGCLTGVGVMYMYVLRAVNDWHLRGE